MEEISISGEYIGKFVEASRPMPFFEDDTVVFGIFALILGVVFYTSSHEKFRKFYTFIPALLLCYIIPALLSEFHIVDPEFTDPYKSLTKPYLLPASLVLLTLGIDFQGLKKLGWKAIAMFATGTVGVIIGGPIAMMAIAAISPDTIDYTTEGQETWRGLSALAGSWIGGGANQAAMLETYKFDKSLFGQFAAVDVIVANIWMAFLLYGANFTTKIDKWLKADSSGIEELKTRMKNYQAQNSRIPNVTDLMMILAIAFTGVGIATYLSEGLSTFFFDRYGEGNPFSSAFFWVVVICTTIGLGLSFTKLRSYEGAGASRIGNVFIYILVLSIGLHIDLGKAFDNPMLLVLGLIWMLIHVSVMIIVAKIIKAPFFFVAVGSKANIGGAASAPVVAAAFDPSLASVGALLAILGYAVGTYGAIACAQMMQLVAP